MEQRMAAKSSKKAREEMNSKNQTKAAKKSHNFTMDGQSAEKSAKKKRASSVRQAELLQKR